MTPLTEELPRMIAAGRNQWLMFEEMMVYVRVGKKFIDGDLDLCIQLANLSLDPKEQGKGTFTRLVSYIQETTKLPIYVEQILNRRFFDALLKRGFTPAKEYEGVIWDLVLIRET